LANLRWLVGIRDFPETDFHDQIIISDSQHNSQHKAAAFNFMLNRICTYPIPDDHRAKEIETIKKIAKVNGYGKKFIHQMYQHHLKKKQLRELTTLTPASDEQTIKRVTVPFHPPNSNKLQADFKKDHSTRGKLGKDQSRDTPKIGHLSN
jgi:predicted acetyltransferase